ERPRGGGAAQNAGRVRQAHPPGAVPRRRGALPPDVAYRPVGRAVHPDGDGGRRAEPARRPHVQHQPVRSDARRRRLPRVRRRHAGSHRPRARESVLRGPGIGRRAQHRLRAPLHRRAARHRLPLRARQLRQRHRLVRESEAAVARLRQDRRRLYARSRGGRRESRDGRRDDQARAYARLSRRRRADRGSGVVRGGAQSRRRLRAGLRHRAASAASLRSRAARRLRPEAPWHGPCNSTASAPGRTWRTVMRVDYASRRDRMVRLQLARRGIRDPKVTRAMTRVPREKFVPEELAEFAYDDTPLPLPENQTISQPYVVALMTEALELDDDDRVLEIGTGSGYSAAVLAEIAAEVFTIERHPSLADAARARLEALGYDNVHVRCGDGTLGWPEEAPFDAIVVTAGGPAVPRSLREQLAQGGRLVIPVGVERVQRLLRIRRTDEDRYDEEDLGPVLFVPLIGEEGDRKS